MDSRVLSGDSLLSLLSWAASSHNKALSVKVVFPIQLLTPLFHPSTIPVFPTLANYCTWYTSYNDVRETFMKRIC
jgi:hypothetical protein